MKVHYGNLYFNLILVMLAFMIAELKYNESSQKLRDLQQVQFDKDKAWVGAINQIIFINTKNYEYICIFFKYCTLLIWLLYIY